MLGLAAGFVAYSETGSVFWTAMVAGAFGIGFAIASLHAGVVVDVIGLRATLGITLVASSIGVGALSIAAWREHDLLFWFVALGFVGGFLAAFMFVGIQLLIHDIVPSHGLTVALSADTAATSVARVAGPTVGGLLLAISGVPLICVVDVASFVPLGVLVLLTKPHHAARAAVPRRARLRDAVGIARARISFRWLLAIVAIGGILAEPVTSLMPAIADSVQRDEADRLGLLLGFLGLGALLQLVVVAAAQSRLDAAVMIGAAYAALGLILLAIGADIELWVIALVLVGFGLAAALGRSVLLTCVHIISPDSHRHHLLALYTFVGSVVTPLAAVLWGLAADRVGIDWTTSVAGGLLVVSIAVAMHRPWRDWSAAPSPPPEVQEAPRPLRPGGEAAATRVGSRS